MKNKIVSTEETKTHPSFRYDRSFALGPWSAYNIVNDPMHFTFVFSRYKFCAKMLYGKKRVLEVGCGDGIGTPIVAQVTGMVYGIDIDKQIIESDKKRLAVYKNIKLAVWNILESSPEGLFDAVYSVDVIEHIPPRKTDIFLKNITNCLTPHGVCVIGTPHDISEAHSSPGSRAYHVNLLSFDALNQYLKKYFHNVFMFTMNDEVVHTGFAPMAHYLIGMGVCPK